MFEGLTITSNYHDRDVIYWHDLTEEERNNLDYVIESGREWWQGFRYMGSVYDLGEFEIAPHELKSRGWDGWQTDSCFSGIAVRYFDEEGNETISEGCVKVARVHW